MFQIIRKLHQRHSIMKTRKTLLSMDEYQLRDIGLSRALIERGTPAWPWRYQEANTVRNRFDNNIVDLASKSAMKNESINTTSKRQTPLANGALGNTRPPATGTTEETAAA